MKPKSFPKLVPHHCVFRWPALSLNLDLQSCSALQFPLGDPTTTSMSEEHRWALALHQLEMPGRRGGCRREWSMFEKLVTSFTVLTGFSFS